MRSDEARGLAYAATACALLALILAFFPYVFGALSGLAFIGMTMLDFLFSARLTPQYPWLGWLIVGTIMGTALAFWTIAPVYGARKYRPAIIAVPSALLVGLMIFSMSHPVPHPAPAATLPSASVPSAAGAPLGTTNSAPVRQ